MIALTIMSGAVTKKRKLTFLTKVKLRLSLRLAKWLHFNQVPYWFVFPQGARDHEPVRPCDIMSRYVLMHDPYCTQVHVPCGENLLTRADRVAFVEQITQKHKAKVFGFGMIFHPDHYRGLEDDPMKEIFDSEMPGFLYEQHENVVPFKRPTK